MTDIAMERAALKAQGLDIIGREQWGAIQPYASARDVTMPARGFVLHISVTVDPDDFAGREDDSMRVIERIGQERFGIGFPYNAAAFDTGRLYEGQPLTRRGAHTVNTRGIAGFPRDMNWAWRALCLPQMVADQVTDAQIDAAAKWAAAQIRAGLAVAGAVWSGHRDYASKDCPGTNGYARLADLNQLTRRYEAHGLDPQEDDMTPEEADAVLVHAIKTPGHKFRTELAVIIDSRLVLNQIARRGDVDIDEAEVTRQLLTTLTPEAIAAAIPAELAKDVADELAARLAP